MAATRLREMLAADRQAGYSFDYAWSKNVDHALRGLGPSEAAWWRSTFALHRDILTGPRSWVHLL